MELFSFYNRPPRKQQTFSKTTQAVYKVEYDNKGVRHLNKDKDIDIYEKIQESAKDVGLTDMFRKYSLDPIKELKNSEEQLIDLTNLPTNLMEAMTVINDAQYAFDRQSKEIKQKFNNDFKQFLAASETGQLAQLLNDEIKTSAERFKTANMANFDANNVNLINHPVQNAFRTPISSPQGQTQTQTATNSTQNIQQGVNLNV